MSIPVNLLNKLKNYKKYISDFNIFLISHKENE
jgi:hypothetical protein